MAIWDKQSNDFVRDEEIHCPESHDTIDKDGERFALRHESRIHTLTQITAPNPLNKLIASAARVPQPTMQQVVIFYCVFCRTVMVLQSLGEAEQDSDHA